MRYGIDTTKAEATAEGKKVKKIISTALKGNKLKLEVFENLGWKWHLIHRHFGIYPSSMEGRVFILMSPNGHGSGRTSWMVEGDVLYRDVPGLLSKVLRKAKDEVEMLQDCIREVETVFRIDA